MKYRFGGKEKVMSFGPYPAKSLKAARAVAREQIDRAEGCIHQTGRDVGTKASKTITTYMFPVAPDLNAYLDEWLDHPTTNLLFGPTDPVFPKTHVGVGNSGDLQPLGLMREH